MEVKVNEILFGNEDDFDEKDKKFIARERLIHNLTEDILIRLEGLGMSKQDLAKMIGKPKSHVAQLLSGDRNMTLGVLSDICWALDVELAANLAAKPQK